MEEHYIIQTLDNPKTLRWVEPFEGGLNVKDTGLGNRLLHWEIGYELLRHNNFTHTFIIQEEYWRELEFLYLPSTYAVSNYNRENRFFHNLWFKTVFEIEPEKVYSATPITYKELKGWIDTQNFEFGYDHLYCNFGYNFINEIPVKNDYSERGLRGIKLRDAQVEFFLRKFTLNVIGLHIRRGEGIILTPEVLKTIPEEYQKYYKVETSAKVGVDSAYLFQEDKLYFDIIDSILKLNPDQKFYISSDVDFEAIEYYKEKYGKDTILHKGDYMKEMEHYYDSHYGEKWFPLRKQAVVNLLDLFSLAYCNMIVKPPHSTFAEIASIVGNIPYVLTTDKINDIMKTYLDLKLINKGKFKRFI